MATANVLIHSSQFPDAVRRDLLISLRTRRINHKFHYDSIKQTQKWLALHEAHSPARNDRNCLDTYDIAFQETASTLAVKKIHVIGLGCGGGQKDVRLLELLQRARKQVSYTPSDVSAPMTLVAREAAMKVLRKKECLPVVCDLATADDLSAVFRKSGPSLLTFFGMIPNFEPDEILPKLAALVHGKDYLLFSANLAPGPDYVAGVKQILPQYDNILTQEWLLTFLLDLGISRGDGKLSFTVAEGARSLKRVLATFRFSRSREIIVHGQKFKFQRGETMQVFFSYRYTPALLAKNLSRHGLKIQAEWIAPSGEEGVFLCRRA